MMDEALPMRPTAANADVPTSSRRREKDFSNIVIASTSLMMGADGCPPAMILLEQHSKSQEYIPPKRSFARGATYRSSSGYRPKIASVCSGSSAPSQGGFYPHLCSIARRKRYL